MSTIRSQPRRLAAVIEHTALRPDLASDDLMRLCDQASSLQLGAVCVLPRDLPWCRERLEGSGVRLVTVVGFPLGANRSEVKAREAALAVADGAHELDMVIDLRALEDGDDARVVEDIAAVVTAAAGRPVKAILETSLLDEPEKQRACRLAVRGGAKFVKTSTGFAAGGATVDDVRLMRATVGPNVGVKASGGIRTAAFAWELLDAGADRIGTSSGHLLVRSTLGGS